MEATYTHGHHASVLSSHSWRTVENSAAYLQPELKEGLSVLDVGCGPGTITADLARHVAPGRVTGVDNATTALNEAQTLNADIEWVNANAYQLPYPDNTFDIVHTHQLLQHLSRPVDALFELRRVVNADGIVAARDADYNAMTWYPELPELEQWRALYRRIARENGGQPDAGRRLKTWALAAGFTNVTSSASTWCFTEKEERSWWSGLWSDRVRYSAFADQAKESGYIDDQGLTRLADGWRRWGEAENGWFVVVHGEILCRH